MREPAIRATASQPSRWRSCVLVRGEVSLNPHIWVEHAGALPFLHALNLALAKRTCERGKRWTEDFPLSRNNKGNDRRNPTPLPQQQHHPHHHHTTHDHHLMTHWVVAEQVIGCVMGEVKTD